MAMDSCQRAAFDIVEKGHNVYIGGQAGSGKSYLTEQIAKHQMSKGKVVALTCTTGVACSIYPKVLKPMTIHKWAGLSDGRFSNQHPLDLIINDDRYDKSRKDIENTDLLIIDEISMLSPKMFEQLEYILRNIRQCNFPFGGIQIVLVGDFVQLPPVRNTRYRDAGDFCFQSLHFPVHVIFLKTVFRQDDQTFCDILRKVSLGDIVRLVKTLFMICLDHCLQQMKQL